jgi:hypothetical protein
VLNQAPRHKDVWGSGGIAPPLLTSALDGGEWSASRPGRFIPGERPPGTHQVGGWVGPRAGLDADFNPVILLLEHGMQAMLLSILKKSLF